MIYAATIGFIGFSIWYCWINWSPCQKCKNIRSQQEASMVLIHRDSICQKLLYTEFDVESTITNYQKPNNCNIESLESLKLSGYYIQPLHELSLNSSSNAINFYPSWLDESSSEISEIVTTPITVGVDALTVSSSDIINSLYAGIAVIAAPITSGFNHNILQFHSMAAGSQPMPFAKAFISRHELLLITNESDYVGICGALVETGIFATHTGPFDPNGSAIEVIKDEEYFTYRFVGFREYDVPLSEPVDASMLRLVKSNYVVDKSTDSLLGWNSAIPAETWAVPCPPHWIPQF